MQKARIRTGWKNKSKQITVADFANATSAICWRIALNAAKNLHQQDFVYDSDQQRIDVIEQYLFFFIHCTDRLIYEDLDQTQRTDFISSLSADCRRHYLQNALEMMGKSPDPGSFNHRLNSAASSMAETHFNHHQPGYDMYRYLGSCVQEIMGNSQTNKWVIDQVMDIDGPNAYKIFKQSFDKLKRRSGY